MTLWSACYCVDEIPLAERSAASCSFDRRVDRLQDTLALPVTWPRGRKVPSVGGPTSLKPSYWRGERTRLGPISGSSSHHVGTHKIRWEGVASRHTVGWPTPTRETPSMHQRNWRRHSFDARGTPVSVKSRVWRNGERNKRVNKRRQQTMRRSRMENSNREEILESGDGKERLLLWHRGICGPWL